MSRKPSPFIAGILLFAIATTPALSLASSNDAAARNQQIVTHRLEQLGMPHDQAAARVSRLNQDDLATLAANPNMIHAAGSTDTGRELFWGLVVCGIIVGITALCFNL